MSYGWRLSVGSGTATPAEKGLVGTGGMQTAAYDCVVW